MVDYKKCADVELEKVYKGFTIGFSDYIIKFHMSQEDFTKRFFGPEGNCLEHSFVALEGEEPIGVLLGGIKDYEGVKTLRCGTLCIHPDYRGKGISQELFKLHKQTALDNKCKQMFLEVIAGNDRAIKFYSNLGYERIYDINYYTHTDAVSFKHAENSSLKLQQIDFEKVVTLSSNLEDVHINWQNDFDYMKKLEGLTYFGAYENSELIGAISISTSGKIYFIWTLPQWRHRGTASALIAKAVKELGLQRLYISFPNNSKLDGFVKRTKFEKDKIFQYEMYLTL